MNTTINPKNFKAYDIRGIYPTDINEQNFPDIIKAIYSLFIKDNPTKPLPIVLGRDMRLSGPILFEIAKKTLVECGATVIDIGLTSTPTMYFTVMKYQYDAGIQVTASHNPKEYTGIKYLYRKGKQAIKISKNTGMTEVKDRAINQDFIIQSQKGKIIDKPNVLVEEVTDALRAVKPINIRPLTIVVDPANGMGALYIKEIFKQFPAKLVKMNFELDGSFPAHQPDPLQFNLLKDLQERVIKEKADLGIAPDGDGDRVFFIDEVGSIVPATMITAIVTRELLRENLGEKIVADVRYLRNVETIVKKLGGNISVSPVGHALITKQLNDEKAIFAGESSGHFYFRDIGGTESAIRVIFYVLKVIQATGKPLSVIVSELQSSYESGEFNYVIPNSVETKTVLEKITSTFSDGKVNHLDGLAIDYPDWRLSVRSSNTEPIFRLNVEGADRIIVDDNLAKLKDIIIGLGGKQK